MSDIRSDGIIRFRDWTLVAIDHGDPRLLFWACLGRVLSSPSQISAPFSSWQAVVDECEREFDFIAGQMLATGTSDLQYQRAADEFACWREEITQLRVTLPGMP